MWINQPFCCLLAVAHLYSLNLVHSQEADSSHTPHNLKCITHDLKMVICTWTTASATDIGITYRFCHTFSSSNRNCSETHDKIGGFPLMLFDSITIEVFTLKSGKAIAEDTFKLSVMNISLVPHIPHISSLTPDFSKDILYLEWSDGGAVFPQKLSATWEIQILRKDPMEEVALMTYHSELMAVDTVIHWNWKSDIPFECTTHYIRIRSYLNERNFPGKKEWSEWSQFANISGQDTESSLNTQPKVYPIDRVVPIDSNVTACCVWRPGQQFISLEYDSCPSNQCPTVRLSNLSTLIYISNVRPFPSGRNIICEMELADTNIYGTVIFPGYPPDVPRNLTCETRDMKNLMCQWSVGRPTKLYGPRSTKYSVFERTTGQNITIKGYMGSTEELSCKLQILNVQKAYDLTVFASSELGRSEASLQFDVKKRIRPQTPSQVQMITSSPTSIKFSWYLDGSFTHVSLRCQISRGSTYKAVTVLLDGAENSRYDSSINDLLPYTEYTFRVRCSAALPFFWKWSNWSTAVMYKTLEAPPAKALDVWRERSSDGETVNIFWKHLPISTTNGLIQSYEVSWFLSDKSEESRSIPETQNSTGIEIGGNDFIFTVVAKNKGGSSPPSQINTAEILTDDAITENGIATGDGVYVSWPTDSNVTCGFIVRWCQPSGEPCNVYWETFPSNATNAVIKSALFQPGVQYTFSVYACKSSGYQLLKYVLGYIKEMEPRVAPLFKVEKATSDSIWIKWETIPTTDCRGFLKGYLLHFSKEERGSKNLNDCDSGHPEACINITDLKQNTLQISGLQGKTSYYLSLHGYTDGGIGPSSSLYVVTMENSVELIVAVIVPVSIVVVLAVVSSILCYQKREWIKETFYPDIPNPETCKALDFQKDLEGNPNVKTLEMNPCTPNNIEVIETQSHSLKIEDTALTSPVAEDLPEDGFDSETESHIVVPYCPSIVEEEISNPPVDESGGSSQVVYIDIQSMYPVPDKLKDDTEADCVAAEGYKPQMQLPVSSARKMEYASAVEDDMDKAAGYRPQVNAPSWNKGCPDSPTSLESNNENASFGSPCSINSRQFLIPPKEDSDSPKANSVGWSFANFFHNKSND